MAHLAAEPRVRVASWLRLRRLGKGYRYLDLVVRCLQTAVNRLAQRSRVVVGPDDGAHPQLLHDLVLRLPEPNENRRAWYRSPKALYQITQMRWSVSVELRLPCGFHRRGKASQSGHVAQ